MKKTIYLSIITIVTIICIIAGSIYHILGYGFRWLGQLSGGAFAPGSVISDQLTVEPFDILSIDSNVMNIKIQTGDDYSVEYKCNERFAPKIESGNKKLTITQDNKSNHTNNIICELTIIVPKDAEIDELTADLGVGEIDIDSLTIKNSTFDTGVADLKIKDSSLTSCDIDSGTGDNTITNCSFDTIDIDSGIGDNKISSTGPLDGYSFDLDSGFGDIKINGQSYGDEYSAGKNNNQHINVDGGTGDITVKY